MRDVKERLSDLSEEEKQELLAQLLKEQHSQQPQRFPPSFAQQRLWFIDQMGGGTSTAYNLPTPLRLRGPLNVKALERSFNEVIRRHEALRTTFEVKAETGKVEQVIHRPKALSLEIVDI